MSSFKLIIDKLWPDKMKLRQLKLILKEFINKIHRMNFTNYHTSKNIIENLVDFIIETLHKKLYIISGESIET